MSDRLSFILKVFQIPSWYGEIISKQEKKKLWNCIMEASNAKEARLFRVLDCSAFCIEKKCYFCGEFQMSYKQ